MIWPIWMPNDFFNLLHGGSARFGLGGASPTTATAAFRKKLLNEKKSKLFQLYKEVS